jgi:hypothetical protein
MRSSTAADDVEQLQLGEPSRRCRRADSRTGSAANSAPSPHVEIDHANRGEAVEGERQGSSGEEVGFVGQAKMEVGAPTTGRCSRYGQAVPRPSPHRRP